MKIRYTFRNKYGIPKSDFVRVPKYYTLEKVCNKISNSIGKDRDFDIDPDDMKDIVDYELTFTN